MHRLALEGNDGFLDVESLAHARNCHDGMVCQDGIAGRVYPVQRIQGGVGLLQRVLYGGAGSQPKRRLLAVSIEGHLNRLCCRGGLWRTGGHEKA